RADLDTQRHPFLDPFPILDAAADFSPIDEHFDWNAGIVSLAQTRCNFVTSLEDCRACLLFGGDWQNDNLRRRNARRQNGAIVITVHHHNRADEPRTHTPASRPAEFLFAFAIL